MLFCSLALMLAACASHSSVQVPLDPDPQEPGTGRVEVTIKGFGNDEGQVLIALFRDDSGWPDDESQAFAASVLPIRNHRVVTTFEGVPAGSFAISVFHDENLDGKLDTGTFGIPTEAYGFSRDARGTFGPPGFDEARLELAAGQSLSISVQVN